MLSLIGALMLCLFMWSCVLYWLLQFWVDHFGSTVITRIEQR